MSARKTQGFAQLSHTILDSEKVWQVVDSEPHAFALWVMAVAYCSRSQTDGLLNARAQRFLGLDERTTRVLIDAGLFDLSPDGTLSVHDYLEWNNSKEEIEQVREQARARQQRRRNHVTRDITRDVTRDVTRTSRLQDKDKDKDKDKIKDQETEKVSSYRRHLIDVASEPQTPPECADIDEWTPPEELTQLARDLGFNPLSEEAKFRARIIKHGTRTHNLNSSYENWLRTGAAKGYTPA